MKKYIIIAAAVLFSFSSNAREEKRSGEPPTPVNAPSSNVDCNQSSSSAELDINNVRAFILNGGDMWWDQPGTGNARYEIPKLDDPNQVKKNSLFAGSVWIGGRDQNNGNILVTAQTYRQSHYAYWPGPLEADSVPTVMPSITSDECNFWNKHFKVNKATIETFKEDFKNGAILEQSDIPDAILNWPARNNPYVDKDEGSTTINFDRDLAPFIDVSGEGGVPDGNYDPLVGDYPDILGDQTIWWVMNDIGNIKQFGGSLMSANEAIGLELETRAFAFQTNDAVNDMTFYEQILTNKGNKTLVDTYIGQWVDPDLGNYVDDYVGCDVARGLGICYNGDDDDDGVLGYGLNPPAIGVDFFQGPLADLGDGIDNDRDGLVDEGSDGIDNDLNGQIDDEGEREGIVMSKFLYYNNNANPVNGNPASMEVFYNYLRNIWGNGDLVMYDGADGTDQSVGIPADFMFPGNTDQEFYWGTDGVPVAPWDEVSAGNAPADRRFLQSAGPFTLEPGQQNVITIGVVWCRAGSGGATGSIACLKAADDLAQELFDREFKDFNGPNPPQVGVTELDREVVLSLTPSTFIIDDVQMTTETYQELDRSAPVEVEDPYYRFQGYLIYQLKDETVSSSDLDNTDAARLIAQCDKQDGISSLINYVNMGEPQGEVAVEMVDGADAGVFHTLSITSDAFNAGNRIVNNKEYYYMVIAYGSNVDPVNAERKADQYIGSRKEVNRIVAVPHKPGFVNGGLVANADYGTGIDITAINGTGTGGVSIDYTTETVNTILASNVDDEPTYAGGAAPIAAKVYDPYGVKAGDFKVRLYSRLIFDLDESDEFQIGDEIVAIDTTSNADIEPSVFDTDETGGEAYIYDIVDTFEMMVDTTIVEYIPELTQVQYNPGTRDTVTIITAADTNIVLDTGGNPIDTVIVPSDTTITTFNIDTFYQEADTISTVLQLPKTVVEAKVVITNDSVNGSFSKHLVVIEEVEDLQDPNNPQIVPVFQGYSELPLNFHLKSDPSKTGRTYSFTLHEFFEIEDEEGNIVDAEKNYRVSEYNEVLLSDYGITLQMQHGYPPEFEKYDRSNNGFNEATFDVTSGNDWLQRVERPENLELPYWLGLSPQDAGISLEATTTDPTGVFYRVANGAIAPYNFTKTAVRDPENKQATKGGPKYPVGSSKYRIKDLPNIDVVIDYDNPENWTRVPVLQADFRNGDFIDPNYFYNRSNQPSLQLQGGQLVAGGIGTGMSYFPGYAIDLDRGIRLNMMFSESKESDPVNGNNLIWEPTADEDGGKSYVYIMGTEYDPEYYENIINDAEEVYESPVAFSNAFSKVFDDVAWIMNLKRSQSQAVGSGNYKIRVRVDKYFHTAKTKNNPIPEYGFSTDGYVPTAGDQAYLESLCDNFRVVPNPYYAYSEFENGQLDNRVRLTNLPKECTINIFTLNGQRVKTFVKNDNLTYLDWNLLNETGLRVASGTYLIHVEAPGICQKVVKFFGILRPLDLDTF